LHPLVTAWLLRLGQIPHPQIVDTLEIGYLKGRRTSTVEQGETDVLYYVIERQRAPTSAHNAPAAGVRLT